MNGTKTPPLPPSPAEVSDLILQTREHVQSLGWGNRERLYTESQVRAIMAECAAMVAAETPTPPPAAPSCVLRLSLGGMMMSDRELLEMARMRRALHEIAEEWAGAECGEPVHAQEAYAIGLAKRMYALAVAGLMPLRTDERREHMSDLRAAALQALEALKGYRREMACGQPCDAERVLEATLAQQEQPDTDCHAQGVCQRSGYSIGERKPLTEDEIERLIQTYSGYGLDDFASVARAVERAHGIGGSDE